MVRSPHLLVKITSATRAEKILYRDPIGARGVLKRGSESESHPQLLTRRREALQTDEPAEEFVGLASGVTEVQPWYSVQAGCKRSKYGVNSKLLRFLQSALTFEGPCAVSYQGTSSRATPCTAQHSDDHCQAQGCNPLVCRRGHCYSCILCFVLRIIVNSETLLLLFSNSDESYVPSIILTREGLG